MYRIVFLFLILCQFSHVLPAQNLIPDTGFEDWDGTIGANPNTLGGLNLWYEVNGTPDHHHELNPPGNNLTSLEDCPLGNGQNQCGVPFEGEAVLGIYKANGDDGSREWAGIEMVPPMQEGECHYISFWIQNKKDNPNFIMETNQWGVFFSNTELPAFDPNTADYSTLANQYVTCEEMIDGSEWHHLEFTYTADDNYSYAYIGYMGNVADATENAWSDSWSIGFYVWYDAVEVETVTQPELIPGPDIIMCDNEESFIYAESNLNVTWSSGESGDTLWLNLTEPGTYEFDVFAGEGSDCELMETITVTVNNCSCPVPITASVAVSNDTSCPSDVLCNGTAIATPNNGLPPFTYQWDDPLAQTGAEATGLCPGVYTCIVEDSQGCDVVVEAVISGLEPVVLNIITTPVTCIGLTDGTMTSIVLSGEEPLTYELDGMPVGPSVEGLATGIYTLEITYNFSCLYSQEFTVGAADFTTIETEVPGEICLDSEPFILDPSLGPGIWTGPGIIDNATGEFNPILAGAGQHSINFVSENSCDLEYDVQVTVRPEPNVNFVVSDEAGCPAFEVIFDIQGFQTEGVYTWDFGDGDMGTGPSPISHVYTQSGVYDVSLTVTDEFGCEQSNSQTNLINVAEVPTAAFSFTPKTLTEYDNLVRFTDESIGANSWFWDFGNGETSTQRNPELIFEEPGNYVVELRVMSSGLCLDSAYSAVRYPGEVVMWIPNAFTPDGDGLNDVFKVVSNEYFTAYEIYIYDRWGNVVFHSTDVNEVWHGDANGEFAKSGDSYYQEADVYNYVISYNAMFATGGNIETEYVKGNVTLIR